MNVKQLTQQFPFTVFCGQENLDVEITGGYASDLLSDVMGFAKEGEVWITLQTHKNVIAIASLKELAAVVLVKKLQPDEDMLQQAIKEGIPVLGTSEETFETVGKIYNAIKS